MTASNPPSAEALEAAINFLWPIYRRDQPRDQVANEIQCQRLAIAFDEYGDKQAHKMSVVADKIIEQRAAEARRGAIDEERVRIAQRVSELCILRLQAGCDPITEANEIIQHLAHDIRTNWADYEDGSLAIPSPDTIREGLSEPINKPHPCPVTGADLCKFGYCTLQIQRCYILDGYVSPPFPDTPSEGGEG